MSLEASAKELDSVELRVADLDLDAAVSAYETLFDVPAVWGKADARPAAHFVLGNVIFEVVAGPEDPGLGAMRFLVEDLEAVTSSGSIAAVRWQAAETDPEERRVLRIDPARTGGQAIELVDRPWRTPKAVASPSGVHALDHAVVRTREADAARSVYEGQLGIRVAFDRSFEEWKTRLIMCKLGRDATVIELAARLGVEDEDLVTVDEPRDVLWGFTWRVGDLPAAHARLEAAGVEISPVRKGRRPGTQVATVRDSGTVNVPTLLIGPDETAEGR